MRTTMRTGLLKAAAGLGALAAASAGWAQAEPAADTAAAQADDSESSQTAEAGAGEIVVVARRRAERLLDVPIGVTAIGGEALEQAGISDVRDLQYRVPSLQITTNTSSRNTVSYAIRGQRVHEYNLLTDPAINTYFAEVVQPRTYGFGYTLYDLASVQVLRGVQGTLFGRNATGGAVLIEPNRPTDRLEGEARFTIGRFDLLSFYGMANLPIAEGVSVRIAGENRTRDGFTYDVRNDRYLDDVDYFTVRGSLLLAPDPAFSNLTIVDHLSSHNNGSSAIATILRQTGTPVSTASRYGQALADLFAEQQALGVRRVVGTLSDGSGAAYNPYPGRATFDDLRNTGITNRTEFHFGDFTLKNVLGYRSISYDRLGDFYFLPLVLLTPRLFTGIDQYSEELQLQGRAIDNRLEFTLGGYFFREEGDEIADSAQFPDITPPLDAPAATKVTTNIGFGRSDTYAVYAAGNFALTDQLKLAGGIRWTQDDRLARVSSVTAAGACRLQTDAGAPLPASFGCLLVNSVSTSAFTWDATLQYEPDNATNLYASIRRGYRAGGFNLRARSPTQLTPFQPEYVREYELGAKRRWRFGNATLSTDLALFLQDYSNIQTSSVALVDGRVVGIVSNTASQKNYGLEFESQLQVGGLSLGAYYSYVNISDVRGSAGDFRLRGIPHHTAGLNARYAFDLGHAGGELAVSGSVSYRSSFPLDDFDVQSFQRGYALADARIEWNDIAGSRFSAAAYVNNLTNKVYRLGETSLLDSVGLTSTIFAEPRTWGASLRYRF